MQSLMFLGCFDQKLLKKNLWGVGLTPLGEGRVKRGGVFLSLEILFCPRKYVMKKKHEKKLVNFCFAVVLPVENSPWKSFLIFEVTF